MDNIVIDTNVFISALLSKNGAAFKLLSLVGTGLFDISISVPLILEYEDVAIRLINSHKIALDEKNIGAILDYLCSIGMQYNIYYLWRPFLKDPKDDMLLELAVASAADFIITYNQKDFVGIEIFGLQAITPQLFLESLP